MIYEWKKGGKKGELRKDFLGPWAKNNICSCARLLKRKLKRNLRMLRRRWTTSIVRWMILYFTSFWSFTEIGFFDESSAISVRSVTELLTRYSRAEHFITVAFQVNLITRCRRNFIAGSRLEDEELKHVKILYLWKKFDSVSISIFELDTVDIVF